MKNKLYKILLLIGISSLLFTAAGCNNKNIPQNNVKADNRIVVYTTFYPMYDFAKKIGDDKINLNNLIPSGIEPHDWEPTPRDIANLEKADVLIYNGAGMESWIDKVISSLNNNQLKVIEASKGIKLIGEASSGKEFGADPHVWLNPENAKKEMESIKNVLVSVDPKNKNYYESNFTNNAKRIDNLDKKYKDTVSSFVSKDIIVSHEAFGYLCSAYGLNQIGIEGLSAESEPTPTKMAEVADFAKKNHVKYIFYEKLVSPSVAETIANEAGTKVAALDPIEGLTQDEVNAGKEYFSIMEDNLSTLSKALSR